MKHIHFLTLGFLLSLFAVNAQAQDQGDMQRLDAKTALSLRNLTDKPVLVLFNEMPIELEDYTIEVTPVVNEQELKIGKQISIIVEVVAGNVTYAPDELWVDKAELSASNITPKNGRRAPVKIITEDDLKFGTYNND